jgi:hypothetical protein
MPARVKTLFAVALVGVLGGAALFWGLGSRHPRTFRDAQFVTLGELGRELANDPKTYDAVLERLGGGHTADGLVSAATRLAMRKLFAAADYDALDALPQTSLEELKSGLALLASTRPPSAAERPTPLREPLGLPTSSPGPGGEPFVKDVGLGLFYGVRLDPQKALHFEDSERLAFVLNRLSLPGDHEVVVGDEKARNVDELARALVRQGNTLTVRDERFLANFGDLEWRGHPVATPLWVRVGERAQPVPHAQLQLSVRGPIQADVTFYNSLDLTGEGGGGTLFRGDLARRQPWVGGRVFHVYEAEQAMDVVRWMAALRRGAWEKVAAGHIPLDGYFALGVCTLAPAVAEHAVLGHTTIWPLTQDRAMFNADTELDRLVRSLPADVEASTPEKARVLGAVPWEELKDVPFPTLRASLEHL